MPTESLGQADAYSTAQGELPDLNKLLRSHRSAINQLDDLISATNVECHRVTNGVGTISCFQRKGKAWINEPFQSFYST